MISIPQSQRSSQGPRTLRGADGGFTLIELLLVIGILGLLVAAFLPDLFGADQQAKAAETEARMLHLQSVVSDFERREAFYPPDDLKAIDLNGGFEFEVTTDGINTGIESLVIFTHQRRGGTNLLEHETWLQNTDEDKNRTVIPLLNRKEKVEVVDVWGTPFAYFTGPYEGKKQQIMGPDGIAVPVTPWKNPKSTGYLGDENKFMLISAGPDGVFNTEDDLTYPTRPVE